MKRSTRKFTKRIVASLSCLTLIGAMLLSFTGCTSRGMTITSFPEGAEVSVNRRVIGKTPIRLNYTHYGDYRIELRKDRYKTRVQVERASAPWYGYDPIAFFADNVVPARINDEIAMHYVLEPLTEDFDRDSLMARANAARDGKVVHPVSRREILVEVTPQPDALKGEEFVTPPAPIDGEVNSTGATTGTSGGTGKATQTQPDTTTKPVEPGGELVQPETIKAERPKGPRLSPDEETTTPVKPTPRPKGPTTPGTEKSTPSKPKTETKPKQPRRKPIQEVLIYEEDDLIDPSQKDEKKRK